MTSTVLVPHCHPVKRSIYRWFQADFDHIRKEIQSLCEEFIVTCSPSTPVDVLWNNFLSICNAGLNMIPTKLTSSRLTQPWISSSVKWLSRKKQRAYNCACTTALPSDWSKYYDLKKQCQRECRQAFNNYISSLVDPNNNQVTKRLWSYIKSKKQDHTGIGPLMYQETTITDPVGKANTLADYFSSVFTRDNTSSSLPRMSGPPLPDASPITIHHEGVAQLSLNIYNQIKQVILIICLPVFSKSC